MLLATVEFFCCVVKLINRQNSERDNKSSIPVDSFAVVFLRLRTGAEIEAPWRNHKHGCWFWYSLYSAILLEVGTGKDSVSTRQTNEPEVSTTTQALSSSLLFRGLAPTSTTEGQFPTRWNVLDSIPHPQRLITMIKFIYPLVIPSRFQIALLPPKHGLQHRLPSAINSLLVARSQGAFLCSSRVTITPSCCTPITTTLNRWCNLFQLLIFPRTRIFLL